MSDDSTPTTANDPHIEVVARAFASGLDLDRLAQNGRMLGVDIQASRNGEVRINGKPSCEASNPEKFLSGIALKEAILFHRNLRGFFLINLDQCPELDNERCDRLLQFKRHYGDRYQFIINDVTRDGAKEIAREVAAWRRGACGDETINVWVDSDADGEATFEDLSDKSQGSGLGGAELREYLAAIAKKENPLCQHSADFTSVSWFGKPYQFNKTQAACVQLLWNEWEKGGLGLSEKTIGDKIGSNNDRYRLVHTFRKREGGMHDAWGTMIRSVGKGIFALCPANRK